MKPKKSNANDRGLNVRLVVMITEETKAQLDSLKESSGVPTGEVVRRLIAQANKR